MNRMLTLVASALLGALLLAACTTPAPESASKSTTESNDDHWVARETSRRQHEEAQQQAGLERVQVTGSRIAVKAAEARDMHLAPPPGGAFVVQRTPAEPLDRENYAHFDDNPVKLAAQAPVSTFSVDVDTASYANVRRWLTGGQLPPMDAVRIEELVNYFDYDYETPDSADAPFRFATTLGTAPWNPDALLLRVGLQGYEVAREERPAANLVFLVDVSGSMQSSDKLPLLKRGLELLVNELEARDRVSLVVYAGGTGIVLEPTAGDRKATIRSALAGLEAGGSTNGAAGIRLAYDMAEQGFIKDGINRVILATDGDFNVGTVNFEELVDLVERRRQSGVALTTLGFGSGNYNDRLMEQLADKGNGNHAYIDSMNEARKVLIAQMAGTLMTIAKDVKAQIEFNPDVVAEYRLIGYENRVLAREDFNNDKVDAGDIGAGHSVTALYEVVLKHSDARRMDDLRYGNTEPVNGKRDELAYLKLRYKQPDADTSRLLEHVIRLEDRVDLAEADSDFRFAAAVAAFGQKLRGGKYLGEFDYADIRKLAHSARGMDAGGYRGEFLQLLDMAETLDGARQASR